MTHFFTHDDIGCHADGAFGHQHLRHVLASLVDQIGHPIRSLYLPEWPDDLEDEIEAIDLLNENTEDGLAWSFLDGGLVLVPISELEPWS